ncbi:hypothetical protein F3Y22_tig00110930pilonHSYRG00054 [Hibiscus syriacus]|uniref:Uncharacterized protein n=1 Tax=Hibiscus syriacus TaxID=106335 RepID=A0A6A2ZD56_HIBSY|nr:hypothetical protein F3Y22_tig00110930pilonHSYRG00054 [Hibiscus syriacus]
MGSAWSRVKSLPGKLKNKVISTAKSTKKLRQDDPRRLTHSLKVGLALTLVSLLYYARPIYDGFGESGMWAVLTVWLYLNSQWNSKQDYKQRLSDISCQWSRTRSRLLCESLGKNGEPIVLGILVFLLAAAATFSRFFPRIKARYDYGVMIFILTFIWAGETLHNVVSSNLEKLAAYLEGFGGVYFQSSENDGNGNGKSFLRDIKVFSTQRAVKNHWQILQDGNLDMAAFASAPMEHYLKIGALARQCAYQIEAINGCIVSDDTQVLLLHCTIFKQCHYANTHVENSKAAMKDLKFALKAISLENADLAAILPAATTVEATVSPEKPPQLLHRGIIQPLVSDDSNGNVVITVHEIISADSSEDGKPIDQI